ncbi:MAG: acetyl-CoA carboxylase biotin carboxylase subunit, partial [Pseudomonadota bacterium]
DLIKEQIRVAFGERLSVAQEDIGFSGHAIECRITAEDPRDDFFPSPGCIEKFVAPSGNNIRVDTHCFSGYVVTPFYDSMIAKLITTGSDRAEAIENMKSALGNFTVEGIETNIPFLQFLIEQKDFIAGDIDIKWIERDVMKKFV